MYMATRSLGASLVIGSMAAGLVAASSQQDPPGHLEKPDQKPGDVPLAPRTSVPRIPLQPGGVFLTQVNVNAQGLNIVGDAANEPSIAVDPTDPSRSAIGWRQFDTVNSNFRQAGWAWSDNGGNSWTFPGRIDAGNFRSDPVLEADAAGRFYYSSLRGDFSTDFFMSDDGGQTWGPALPAFGGDKQWFAIDTSGGSGHGFLYETWSVNAGCCGRRTFIRSTDGGFNFEQPIEVPGNPIWGNMCVGPNGDVFVTGREPGDSSAFIVARSNNAQNSGSSIVFDSVAVVDLGGSQSAFGGVNPQGLMGQVWVATSPNNNDVYLLCSVDPPGSDPLDVMFARSTDNGVTWSSPVRVNPIRNGYQWFGAMSIAPNGRIDVTWYDTRNSSNNSMSEVYYSSSTDAGVTWSDPLQVTPAFDQSLGYPQQNKLGDYTDMASFDDAVYYAFATTLNGEQDVYFARITPPSSAADLIGVDVVRGAVQNGTIDDLLVSDDSRLHTRSGFGETLVEAHLLEMLVHANTSAASPTSLSVTVESSIDEPSGTARLSLRNWNTNQFEQIGTYAIGTTEETQTFGGIDPASFIDGSGNIDLQVKHTVFVPFLAFQFDSFFDLVQVDIN